MDVQNEAKPLSKSEIVSALAEATNLNKKQVALFFEKLNSLAFQEVKRCGRFNFPNLGILKLVQRPERTGRNPKTGETIRIPAKKAAKFTLSKSAKEEILKENT